MMKLFFRSAAVTAFFCFPLVSMAQLGQQCASLVTSAPVAIPGGSGTMTIENLTKYGLPAQACTTVAFAGTSLSYDFTTTMATRYNNAKFGSGCAGIEFTLNGGPSYYAITGKGNLSIGAGVSGTMTATAYAQTENLTLSAGGANYVVNTPLQSFKSTVVVNTDNSVDVKICTPKGGVQATVNGGNFVIPTNVWKCLASPTPAQPNVRITYEEGC